MSVQNNTSPNPVLTAGPRRPRILLMAYYCQPNRGSEFGAGWNRAVESAKDYDTWVISRGGETADRTDAFLAANGEVPGLHMEYVRLPAWQEKLLDLPWIKWIVVRWWHRKALELAQRLHREHAFDLVHHVTCISYREPGELWKLGPPFVWGPVGGADSVPWRFMLEGGVLAGANEALRSVVNFAQIHWSRRVRTVSKRARAILFANSLVKDYFERLHGVTGPVLQDIGTHTVRDTPREVRTYPGPFRILWSGAMEARKGLSLLLKALAELPPEVPFTVRVLGEGTMDRRWKRQAEQLGIADRIEWLGWLSFQEAHQNYHWADVLVFTSLRDTGGNVNVEAMSNGLPVVCLDHQGVHDLVTAECGIKVLVTNPRGVVRGLRDAIVTLATNPALRAAMGEAARERAREYLWSRNRERMLDVYHQVLADGKPRVASERPGERQSNAIAVVEAVDCELQAELAAS